MKILAVEFSSEERSLAVLETGSSEPVLLGQVCEQGGRRAIELVELALKNAGCEREAIDCLAIGIGPGSYTGIRGAIALAQGWQLGREVKLLGVSSVEALAAQAQAKKWFGTVNIVIDAQRNEFYLSRWEINTTSRREVEVLHLVPAIEVQKLCESGEIVIGPEAATVFPAARNLSPNAVTVGRLASERKNYIAGESMEPIYLRETDFKKAPPRRIIL